MAFKISPLLVPKILASTSIMCVLIACNSDSPLDYSKTDTTSPALNAALPGTLNLERRANTASCPKTVMGMSVSYAPSEIEVSTLSDIESVCKLAEIATERLFETTQADINSGFCITARETADSFGNGNMEAAARRINQRASSGQIPNETSQVLLYTLSVCSTADSIKNASLSIMSDTPLQIHSTGTFTQDGKTCNGVLWQQRSDTIENYQLTGVGDCKPVELPTIKLFHPNNNIKGILLGDYFRDELGYDGVVPEEFFYRGSMYPFTSTEEKATKQSQVSAVKTQPLLENKLTENTSSMVGRESVSLDRSLAGEKYDQYAYWSTGEMNLEISEFIAGSALVAEYHSAELDNLPFKDRARIALERSFGELSVSDIVRHKGHFEAGFHVSVTSASGQSFIAVLQAPDDMSADTFVPWLKSAKIEAVINRHTDRDGDESIVVEGALFGDSNRTIFGRTAACECGAQGVLAYVDDNTAELARKNMQAYSAYSANQRSDKQHSDWTYSNEPGPDPIAYVKSERDDSAYVVRGFDINSNHYLYVKNENECSNDKLWFVIGDTKESVTPSCRKIDGSGLEYSIHGSVVNSKIIPAMKAGAQMEIGLYKPGAQRTHENHVFSLMGVSSVTNQLNSDLKLFDTHTLRNISYEAISSESTGRVLNKLKVAPPPAAAAAIPESRAQSSNDLVWNYANNIAAQMEQAWHPSCAVLASQLRMIASSGHPQHIRERQVDAMIDKLPDICFQ